MFSRRDARLEELRELDIFSACTPRQLELVGKVADEVHLPAGTTLMREGKPGHECFILIDGRAKVSIRGHKMATLHSGDIVGEMALIEQEPRSATVVTTTPVRALALTPQAFAAILDNAPAVARRVLRLMARRLRKVNAQAA